MHEHGNSEGRNSDSKSEMISITTQFCVLEADAKDLQCGEYKLLRNGGVNISIDTLVYITAERNVITTFLRLLKT